MTDFHITLDTALRLPWYKLPTSLKLNLRRLFFNILMRHRLCHGLGAGVVTKCPGAPLAKPLVSASFLSGALYVPTVGTCWGFWGSEFDGLLL